MVHFSEKFFWLKWRVFSFFWDDLLVVGYLLVFWVYVCYLFLVLILVRNI